MRWALWRRQAPDAEQREQRGRPAPASSTHSDCVYTMISPEDKRENTDQGECSRYNWIVQWKNSGIIVAFIEDLVAVGKSFEENTVQQQQTVKLAKRYKRINPSKTLQAVDSYFRYTCNISISYISRSIKTTTYTQFFTAVFGSMTLELLEERIYQK